MSHALLFRVAFELGLPAWECAQKHTERQLLAASAWMDLVAEAKGNGTVAGKRIIAKPKDRDEAARWAKTKWSGAVRGMEETAKILEEERLRKEAKRGG